MAFQGVNKLANVIGKFDGENYFLSNFSPSEIMFDYEDEKLVFKNGEAAFQAAKVRSMASKDPAEKSAYVKRLEAASSPNDAKYAGRSVKIDLEHWETIKVKCMREVVFQKFQQNPELRVSLMQTGHALLVEGNTWGDKFWGRCEGKGFNILGGILMEVRGYYLWTAEYNRRAFQRDMG
ncbi:hypothetical protein SEA_CIRCINUS_178 [Streptomyces phage Circinus]|uniref:NADAR domain-containing protein n=1 Tax=Streptomyces phage Circinus TaxID=2562189 RepID=A0A4D6E300_9CAUD|nr:hypothetical protein SEA_CIRCINUS_178 [Streptomyces phage Circinus]